MTFWSFLLAAAGIGCCALAQRWCGRRVQQSERRYRQLIECAPIGIAVVAADGQQLLAFSREQPNQPTVSLDLNRLIDDSRDLLQLLGGKEVRIEMRLAPALHSVGAVFGQIAQVLTGLVTHAQCTTVCGRTPTFGTANAPKGVALSVTDTGLELDEETRAHLFKPFAGTARGCRMGLGLAVAHGIVARHGRHIEVTGHPGRGTSFTIHLPTRKGSFGGTTDLAR